ncbi:MAG TPA: hypothetical protein PKY81_00560 [bacterium]|nr:hypothetical protein [bacterium]HPN29424.1 hypothetical protein [bacterium]
MFKIIRISFAVFFCLVLAFGCASKRVDVDSDINADTGVTNVDIETMASKIAGDISKDFVEIKGKTVALRSIDNMTSEHFNTKIISEKIKEAIKTKSGAVFVERDRMSVIEEEQNLIDRTAEHIQQRNKFWGADYLMYGRIDSIDKTRSDGWNPITKKQETYFRLSITITNTTTGVELWSGQAEFKKTQVKSRW